MLAVVLVVAAAAAVYSPEERNKLLPIIIDLQPVILCPSVVYKISLCHLLALCVSVYSINVLKLQPIL
jgi:hypothetical protein